MRRLLLFCMAFGLAMSAQAQMSIQNRIKLGLKLGVGVSVFTKDVSPFDPHIPGYYDTFNNYVRFAGTGGATIDFKITGKLSLGAELLYAGRGMSYREENYDVVIYGENGEEQAYNYYNFRIDYMELPVRVNYNVLPDRSTVRLDVYGGFARGVAVHKTTKLIYPKADGYDAPENDRRQLMNVKTFATNVIGGLKVGGNKPAKWSPFGDLRGSYMLSPVFNRSQAERGGNLDTRMFTLFLTLGLDF